MPFQVLSDDGSSGDKSTFARNCCYRPIIEDHGKFKTKVLEATAILKISQNLENPKK